MKAHEVLRTITKDSGSSDMSLSAAMGRNTNFLGVIRSRGTIPKTDTFAMIADTCGYDLLVRKRETHEEIVIDPPIRE